MKKILCLFAFILSCLCLNGQVDTSLYPLKKYIIQSEILGEQREFWVSLPLRFDPEQTYHMAYVFDAEWRVDMVGRILYDLAGNQKIPPHIVVGIPHVDWRKKRGIDLTFSQSRIEYDGEIVDSTYYNSSNSGGAERFYNYFINELIPIVEKNYKSNGNNLLIGHSYGGYFGSYILGRQHPFTAFHIYDPSIWFSNGEAIERVKNEMDKNRSLKVFISYQPEPAFHSRKIETLIETLKNYPKLEVHTIKYEEETHNSLYLPSLLEGMKFLYEY